MEPNKASYARSISHYNTIILLMRLLQAGVIVMILIFLLPLAVPFIENAKSFQYIRAALNMDKSVYNFVNTVVPTKVAGRDITRVIMLAASFVLMMIIGRIQGRFMDRQDDLNVKAEYEDWKQKDRERVMMD